MEDQEQSSPWERMKQSRERQPDFKERSVHASVKQAIRYLLRVSFLDFLRLQFPRAVDVPDSERYLALYVPQENAAKATWTVLSKRKRPNRKPMRKPIVVWGRRLGIVGTLVAFLAFTISISLIRTALLP